MAALTTKRRNALPTGDFAGPKRSYPIDTAGRARNALARASQNASPAVQAQVRKKVAREYPGIEQSKGPEAKNSAQNSAKKPASKSNAMHKPPQHEPVGGNIYDRPGRGAGGTNQRLAKRLDQRLDQRMAERRRP